MAQLGSGVIPVGNGDKPPTNEIGSMSEWALGNVGTWSSLQAYDELETNPKLTFPESIHTYHAMKTDPQVQGLLTGATWPLMRMRWYIDPNGAPDDQVQHISADLNLPIGPNEPAPPPPQLPGAPPAPPLPPPPLAPGEPQPEVFHQRRSQGRFDFLHHLEEALDALTFGFNIFEQVGYIGDDGLFHYRKLALRPAQTITEIQLKKDGGIDFVRQGNLLEEALDINRIVVYSFQRRGANWHGRSMLRGCYAPWLLKDRAMRVGVMNIQRAGVGTPIAKGHPGATETDLRVLSELTQKFVAGDRSGGAIPYGSQLELVGVTGSQPDTVGFIKLMNEEMARAFFQMFMQLGQTTSGSRALGSTFVDYHKLVSEYTASWFCQIFNEHVIEDDIDWNYGTQEEFAPLLAWKWDEKGSEANPEGPAAARDPSLKVKEMLDTGKIQVDDKTRALVKAKPKP